MSLGGVPVVVSVAVVVVVGCCWHLSLLLLAAVGSFCWQLRQLSGPGPRSAGCGGGGAVLQALPQL